MNPYETLVKYRAEYPTILSPAQQGELLNRVAWDFKDLGMALLGKQGGANVPTPSGLLISSDYLIHIPTKTGYDVLTNNEKMNAIPVEFDWNPPGPEDLSDMINNGARTIVPPTLPSFFTPDVPPVIPVTVDISAFRKELDLLKVQVESNRQRMEAINTNLRAVDDASVKKPLPNYTGTIFGFRFTATPTVK